MTTTTGLHVRVSVSFEDKNAYVGGKGKEVSGSLQSLSILSNRQTTWKQKLTNTTLQSEFTLLLLNNTKLHQSINGSKEQYSKLQIEFHKYTCTKLTNERDISRFSTPR